MDIRSIKNLFKLLSVIGLSLSFFFVIPIVWGVMTGEDYERFLLFNALLFSINLFFYLVLWTHKVELSVKQGIVFVNIIWILLAFAGSVPLMLYSHITWAQAIFESVSGFTTTGATIYADVEVLPQMILMHRSLMQWLGGMGIIVLGVGLFSLINPSGSLTLFKAESTGVKMEKMTPRIKDTALRIWGVYILLTLVDAILLKLEGMSAFDAINHAFATISTGGFSTKNASFGYFENPLMLWTTTFFMIVAGMNFLVHLRLFSGDWHGYKTEEVKWYLVIFLFLSLALSFEHNLLSTDTFMVSLTHASFTIASILTTTGFASLDYSLWGNGAIALVIMAMLTGGNAGSTSGGVKVIRYIVVIKSIMADIKKVIHPNAIINIFIDRNKVQSKVMHSTYAFVMLYVFTVLLVMLYLFASGYDMMTSLSTSLSAVGNIGPGFSLTGPAANYSFFKSADLNVLSVAMIIGRLEFFTVLVLLSRNFWKQF